MQAISPYYKQSPAPIKEGFSLKEKIAYGIATGLVIGAGVYFIHRAVKKSKEKKSDSKSFEDGSPQTIAKQIKMAFENDGVPGTDLDKLRRIMSALKSKEQFTQVQKEYEKQFHSLLLQDMKGELESSEYDEMLYIKESKPDKAGGKIPLDTLYKNWARRLKAAFEKTYSIFPGTDEKNIKAVFSEIPTQKDFIQVGLSYYRLYKANLITDLKSELEYWEYPDYMKIIALKPKGQ